jgi:dipeptidyl aminopeptidase/acylaminoacyl peptidase
MTETATPYKPLTPEEIVDRLEPAKIAISPDGRHVAFNVAKASKAGEHPEQAIWFSRNGEPAAQFTAGSANDGTPVWSPDSKKLLFTSDRKERGKSRLYSLSIEGGEALPIGDLEGALSGLSWSPDGKLIAVLRTDPETPEEKKKKEDRDDPIIVEEQPKFSRLWIVDPTTGKARCLTFGPRHVEVYAWSLDGKEIAFTVTKGPEADYFCQPTPVYVMPVSGGMARHITTFPMAPGGLVYVESTGKTALAVHTSNHQADPADSIWLAQLDGSTEPVNLLPGFEGGVEGIASIAGDPGSVLARVVVRTHGGAYRFSLADASLAPITPSELHGDGSLIGMPSISSDGSKIAVIWADGDKMAEAFIGRSGGKAEKLTDFGKTFNDRLSPVEHVTWQSDGFEIEGLLTLPHGYEEGKRYPLVIEIHGGPTWQWEDYAYVDWHDWAQYLASHGFAVLAPNPRGSSGRGSAFQKELINDVGGGEVRDLITGAQAMVDRGIADPERLGIGGWSWGGYLTAITITQTTMFKAAMMGAGLSNLISDHGTDDIPSANLLYFPGHPYEHLDMYWQGSAIKHITNVTTPTLILHGDSDERVQPSQGAEMYRALKVLGVPVQFVRYPREPHGLKERLHQIDLLKRLLDWYTKYLKA